MSKILQKPLACRNAHCGAMCSPANAEFFRSNPSKCYNYERRDDLYMVKSIPLDKAKKACEEIKQLPITDTAIKLVTEVLDKLIESEE